MVKKHKQEPDISNHKVSVEVIVEDVSSHPLCLHGPTLLFSSDKGKYYACSTCRNKKDCTVRIELEDWEKENVRKRNEKYYNLIPKIDKQASWKRFQEIKSKHATDRAYCNTCQVLFLMSKTSKHNKDHKIVTSLTDELLKTPSSWLPPLENDAVEAQYLFTKKSAATVLAILKNNNIKNILCIGTPSVHDLAQADPDFDSLLLDYDSRHHIFNPPNKFIWYNMFNNYMFNGNEDEKVLKNFLKKSRNEGICIVMDPPFGGRVEPLVHTIRQISLQYAKLADGPKDYILPVLWAFPYFAEPYITNLMPSIKMHDFQIEYANHKKFQNKNQGRKFGSPVRFFTNLPMESIDLSNDKNYKLCNKCKYWVSTSNVHCNKCKACTSKNGMTYKHCDRCKHCVKPTFFHCETCARCCQEKGHVCGVVVESQSCYNCNEKGHKKSECPQIDENSIIKKKKRKTA